MKLPWPQLEMFEMLEVAEAGDGTDEILGMLASPSCERLTGSKYEAGAEDDCC